MQSSFHPSWAGCRGNPSQASLLFLTHAFLFTQSFYSPECKSILTFWQHPPQYSPWWSLSALLGSLSGQKSSSSRMAFSSQHGPNLDCGKPSSIFAQQLWSSRLTTMQQPLSRLCSPRCLLGLDQVPKNSGAWGSSGLPPPFFPQFCWNTAISICFLYGLWLLCTSMIQVAWSQSLKHLQSLCKNYLPTLVLDFWLWRRGEGEGGLFFPPKIMTSKSPFTKPFQGAFCAKLLN